MKRKLIITSAVLLLVVLSVPAWAVIPVEDGPLYLLLKALHMQAETSKAAQAAKQLTEAINQVKSIQTLITNFKDYRAYLEVINGKWAQRIPGADKLASMMMRDSPGDLRNLGWDAEIFQRISSVRTKGQAMRELRQLLDAEISKQSLERVRDSVEEVYGEVPVTAGGVPVEAAYREMATVSARVGESTIAIEAKRERIAALREQIESGELAPGDLQRMSTLIAAEVADLSVLQTAAINNATRASVQALGLEASGAGRVERARIRDRAQRLQMGADVHFGLAVPGPREVE